MYRGWTLFASTAVLLAAALPAVAHEDETHAAESAAAATPSEPTDVETLQREVRVLEAEVAELRQTVQALVPSLTMLMPDFAERFHVMHRAGDVGDWAVANHELLAMQQIAAEAERLHPERGQLLAAYMAAPFESLDEAIDHSNYEAFDGALRQTLQSCNACHRAVGSPFIQVTLNPPSQLSMRHPHKLQPSEPLHGHTHGASGTHEAMHEEMHGTEEHHHEGEDHSD